MARAHTNSANLKMRPVWAEVDLRALAHNLRAIRDFVNPAGEKRKTPRKVLSIVKGNGYGHGGPQVAKSLERAGSDWFGVTCTEEGIAVRKAGVRKPILVLTSFVAGEEPRMLQNDLTAVIHRCEQLQALDRAAARFGKRKKVSFHLKIDSGMNRLGIATSDVDCFARQLAKCKHLQLGGIFTHFASSEVFSNTRTGEQTCQQEERFHAALERLRALGVETSRGFIGADKIGLACAGNSSRVAAMAGLDLPIESHVLQAMVSEPVKPVLDTVVTSGAIHFYVSQSDKGELVMGGDLDGFNSYAQRGGLRIIEHVVEAETVLRGYWIDGIGHFVKRGGEIGVLRRVHFICGDDRGLAGTSEQFG